MRRILSVFILALVLPLQAQVLQSPSEFLGYTIGERFTQHHQVVDYFEYVARTLPDQVDLIQYGTSYEGRPLILASLSSSENMNNLDDIREEHLKGLEGNGTSEIAIVWMSYNVHGNEAVATETGLETLYRLLTDKSSYLDNTVVLIDPCLNPDGRERYVNWYKQNKNALSQPDSNSAEHLEGWLSGRANHYMIDLNRDWAWLTQMESQQRLKEYNRWMPHIHADFHEQGMDSPYFFAPAAEPYHEVITDFQREFQDIIGRNNARYFDDNGWFYFTGEVFDLFYPSYGDTYPTYTGAIGLTYEQGGSGRAGLSVITSNGDTLTLKDRIAHHLTTSLSTIEVASGNAAQLNTEFRKFHNRSANYRYQSYVLQGKEDHIQALTDLLDQHQIEYGFGTGANARGFRYDTRKSGSMQVTEKSLVIPVSQARGTLVKVLFEPNAKLSDSLTYDITAWSLPYAYGMRALASEAKIPFTEAKETSETTTPIQSDAYGYVTDWNTMEDARFLADILQKGIRVRRAERAFELNGRNWGHGSLIITRTDNERYSEWDRVLNEAAKAHGKELVATQTGRVSSGKDFGSGYVSMIPKVRIAALSGEPTSTLRFGEVWHFFEQQLGYPLTVLNADYFDRVDLSDYDILILPDGWGYRSFLDEDRKSNLKDWVRNGGRLMALGKSISALGGENGFGIKGTENETPEAEAGLSQYESSRRKRVQNAITGAIFRAKVDPTHPLAFGYSDTYYTLKGNDPTFGYLDRGSNVVVLDGQQAPLAGFAGSNALERLPNSLIFGTENYGRGTVVYFADNPLFRAFWENGKLFVANALFMLD